MPIRNYFLLASSVLLLFLSVAPTQADFITDMVRREMMKQLAKQFGQEAPTVSSANAVFSATPNLPGQSFTPKNPPRSVWTQLATTSDGSVKLAPGDYQFKVWCCCLKHSAHTTAGHLYLLAPIKGKRAAVITALNARAAANSIPGWQTQHLSWDLQAGVHYDQLPSNEQAIVDKYLSDYKDSLSGSQLDRIKGTYDKYAPKIHWPSFDQQISSGQLGDLGKSVLELEQFQTVLTNSSSNSAAGVDALLTRAPSDATGGAQNTPWSQINDRVYGRIYTAGTAMSYGTLQVRVLPDATANNAADQTADVPISSLEGEPQNENIQPLSIQPVLDAIGNILVSPAEAGEPSPTSPNNGVNWNFIAGLEGQSLTGYVPDAAHSNSGTTIGMGIDLGQRSEQDINNLAIPDALKSTLDPYAGLTGQDAKDYLAQHPLAITQSDEDTLNQAVTQPFMEHLESQYNAATTGTQFSQLPGDTQTVIASVAHQYGDLSTATPQFWSDVTHQDWAATHNTLQNFGDNYPTRRHSEATLLPPTLTH